MAGSRELRQKLVEGLERRRLITSAAVRDAFLAVPRERFVPEVSLEEAYRDEAIVTKHDVAGAALSSSSQPAIMAIMLEALDVRPGQRVLEIGAGTGYNAALLAELAGPGGDVTTVELDADTAGRARRALERGRHRVRVITGDGHRGAPGGAPYDRIVVTASAAGVPAAWAEQLAGDGLLEVPLRLRGGGLQVIPTLRRDGEALASVSVAFGGFLPLRGEAGDPAGETALLTTLRRDGRSEPVAYLEGASLGRLSGPARRALLGAYLSRPRRARAAPAAEAPDLALYLGLQLPRTRMVVAGDGVGAVSRGGAGLAVLGYRGELRVYGEGDAEPVLVRAVEAWRRAGRPGSRRLRVRVRPGAGPEGVSWRFGGG